MRKIFICSVLALLFLSCSREDGIRYHDTRLVVTGDKDILFSNRGETRTFTAAFEQQRYRYGEPLDEWITVPADKISIIWADIPEQLVVSDQKVVGDALSFRVTAQENGFGTLMQVQLEAWLADEGYSDSFMLAQAPAQIEREFRITSKQNPYTVPLEGGVFSVGFTVECRLTVNGTQNEWLPSSLYAPPYVSFSWMNYCYRCSYAASHHSVELKSGEKKGEYYFELTARPYYLESKEKEMIWTYTIYRDETAVPLLEQQLIHEQDRRLAGTEEARASGSDFRAEPLRGSD